MASYKKILELYGQGYNYSQIGKQVGCDRATARKVVNGCKKKGILPTQWRQLEETQLRDQLRKETKAKSEYLPMDFKWMHGELSNAHVTVNLLHEEYEQKAHEMGLRPYSRSQFFERYHNWSNRHSYSAKIKAKPGHSVELDFAGDLVHYIDPLTRIPVKVTLFVATLSFSKLLYVQAVERQKAICLAHATIGSFKYFGGVTRAIIVDNTKAAIILHSKHELAVLNELFRELAEHYGATVIAAPPRSPKLKPNVESGVSDTYTRILAPLRHCTFYSLDELNEALYDRCETFNGEPFKDKKQWTRRSIFEAEEQQMLSQLPSTNFEVREKTIATVRENCHAKCSLDGYYYSVPYRWCKKRVTLRLGSNDVLIYSQTGQFIRKHPRGADPWDRYVTDPTDMPSYIRQYAYASPALFCEQAGRVGSATLEVIGRLFAIAEANDRVVEAEYESAKGILGLARPTKKHSARCPRILEAACTVLVELNPNPSIRISYRSVYNTVRRLIDEEVKKRTGEFISNKLGAASIMDILQREGANGLFD
ncbi:MAG: IS21 family transposase [Spirochaetales bacterium]|nr:IS21 family transposase [Spirochaetales bacterium]